MGKYRIQANDAGKFKVQERAALLFWSDLGRNDSVYGDPGPSDDFGPARYCGCGMSVFRTQLYKGFDAAEAAVDLHRAQDKERKSKDKWQTVWRDKCHSPSRQSSRSGSP